MSEIEKKLKKMKEAIADETAKEVYENLKRNKDKKLC